MKIYFVNSKVGVIGHYVAHEENGNESWFAVSAPIKFNIETNESIDETNKDNENVVFTFRLNNVDYIEVF